MATPGPRPPAARAVTSASRGFDMKNPSLVVTADGHIKLQDAPVHEPGPDEVLLHVRATGVCGSDIHFWHHGRIGDITVDGDCILGHEAAAVVLEVGSAVTRVKRGDRVAIEPGVSCGRCFLCIGGRYNLCQHVAFSGVYPHHGTMQRYKTHPASHVHRLPDSIGFTAAALLEPLSVALHALRTSPVTLGSPVAVFGAGPIGLLAMAAARASGAHPIVITDVDPARLAFAREFEPACRTYLVHEDHEPAESGCKIRALFVGGWDAAAGGGTGEQKTETKQRETNEGDEDTHAAAAAEYDMPQLVLECTGVESSIATAAYTVRRGGCINVVGVSPRITIDKVPFMHLSLAEVKLLFINRYHDTWPAAVRAVEGGLIDQARLESLVTHRFALDDAVAAMKLVGGGRHQETPAGGGKARAVVKVQIVDGAANA
ncbi:alcohol dehydrogenase groES-like domain-containing protein [Hirsutella rhossiliensis]|uniref:Alcohol dehydrogenase groES-like domain-containing protein n=1 Tax=Hirsutella rhossiliensis TaxID=111463 RepID=A0A9P8SHW5_9HYPO|nr:alcohol dehydrogenase groES-like domain-containing protein [Hirsutella rhossiliensis]KAH0961431.1 alcohol dehydrogenase groES-like domain-containing protein [Hirsutella rhossiliensis]